MTGTEIITDFEGLIDDSLDTDIEVSLLNKAMHKIIGKIKPRTLLSLDTSQTATTGDIYTTFHNLPTDFLIPDSRGIIYVGTQQYRQIPMERREMYKNSGNVWYIDYKNSRYALCGRVGSSQTITFPYIAKPTEYTTANLSTELAFLPDHLAHYVPYKMAEIVELGIDGDDINFKMGAKMKEEAADILRDIVKWNADLIVNSMDRSSSPIDEYYGDDTTDPNLGNY